MSQTKILVVDDEANIRDLLAASLRFAGYGVVTAGNGAGAVSAVLAEEPDLIIMDVMLPDMSGFAATKRLREAGFRCPVIFLSARDSTEDKITGLTVGGDDYVTKPFSLDEILARVAAILRRTKIDDVDATIRVGDLVIDQNSNEVFLKGNLIDLSPTEFKLLRYFMLNPNRVLSKSQILGHVWDYDFDGDSSIVESYISYIRRKLAAYSSETIIHTKRGFGYIMRTR
ncbi:response regulator transcription factor [Tropheryma whipplei]|nr:response regulator transcription factor [Tropheryma whipplei]MCO8182667.1 response regulator transcription factor [Tropheryma whipplei]MCO8190363.1 response regulator transcription factor [Tropheryma whipplei]CAD66743.1 putative two component system response regulator [Tropheryma whipplei TW08/27]